MNGHPSYAAQKLVDVPLFDKILLPLVDIIDVAALLLTNGAILLSLDLGVQGFSVTRLSIYAIDKLFHKLIDPR